MDAISFSDIAIVCCGTLGPELQYLKEAGFLDAEHIFYATPDSSKTRWIWKGSFCSVFKRLKTRRRRSLLFMGGSSVKWMRISPPPG